MLRECCAFHGIAGETTWPFSPSTAATRELASFEPSSALSVLLCCDLSRARSPQRATCSTCYSNAAHGLRAALLIGRGASRSLAALYTHETGTLPPHEHSYFSLTVDSRLVSPPALFPFGPRFGALSSGWDYARGGVPLFHCTCCFSVVTGHVHPPFLCSFNRGGGPNFQAGWPRTQLHTVSHNYQQGPVHLSYTLACPLMVRHHRALATH